MQRRRRLTPEQTVHVVAQVCAALAYAHDQDVIHHGGYIGGTIVFVYGKRTED
jgi:hypothetical protein